MDSTKKIKKGQIEDFISNSTQSELDIKLETISTLPPSGESKSVVVYVSSTTAETLSFPAGWNLYGDNYLNDGTRNLLVLNVNNFPSGITYDLTISLPN